MGKSQSSTPTAFFELSSWSKKVADLEMTCPYCKWQLTEAALAANGGMPYCCQEYERKFMDGDLYELHAG